MKWKRSGKWLRKRQQRVTREIRGSSSLGIQNSFQRQSPNRGDLTFHVARIRAESRTLGADRRLGIIRTDHRLLSVSEETSDEQLEKPPLPGQLMLFDIARENSPEQDSTQKKPSRKGRRKAARQKDESKEAAEETKAQKKAGPRSSKRRTQQATSKQPGRSTKKKKAVH